MSTLFFTERTFTQKIMGEPISMTRDALGNPLVSIKVPGYERMEFTPEGISTMASLLERSVPEGDEPHQVAARSMLGFGPDGDLSIRFSDAPRSRTLTLSPNDRAEFAALFRKIESHPAMQQEEAEVSEDDNDEVIEDDNDEVIEDGPIEG